MLGDMSAATCAPTLSDPFPVFARVRLLHGPTPLHPLVRLSDALDLDLWVKRDDLTEVGGGGNKLRKLEYLLGAAVQEHADVVLTTGSPQSNHCRLTAAAAAMLGLDCVLLTTQPFDDPSGVYTSSGNRALFDLFGAEVEPLGQDVESAPALEARAAALRTAHRNPTVIPVGGSTPVGCLGYVGAAAEVMQQIEGCRLEPFDCVVLATGSGGMQAGLEVGRHSHGFARRLVGMSVGRRADAQREIVQALIRETCRLLGAPHPIGMTDVSDIAAGPGYGLPGADTVDAIILAARRDGLVLDPVYTAKAFAGLLGLVRTGDIGRGSRVLFWHSGGAPALFAYPQATAVGGCNAP